MNISKITFGQLNPKIQQRYKIAMLTQQNQKPVPKIVEKTSIAQTLKPTGELSQLEIFHYMKKFANMHKK